MTEIRNSQIENIKISPGVYVVDAVKFLEVSELRLQLNSELNKACAERIELYKIAINESK